MSIGSRRWPTAALLAALLWPGHSHAADDFSRAQALERIARDVRVVRQHVTVANHQIDDAGRVLLGLPAKGLMLAGTRN